MVSDTANVLVTSSNLDIASLTKIRAPAILKDEAIFGVSNQQNGVVVEPLLHVTRAWIQVFVDDVIEHIARAFQTSKILVGHQVQQQRSLLLGIH